MSLPTNSGSGDVVTTPSLAELEAATKKQIDAVSMTPTAPENAPRIYSKYGFIQKPEYGYGRSELDFLEWEIKRGVLNSMDADQPGSPWWRKVNTLFCYYSELAGKIHEAGLTGTFENPVQKWLDYFANPDGKTWYAAHNSSISQGYIQAQEEAKQEINTNNTSRMRY